MSENTHTHTERDSEFSLKWLQDRAATNWKPKALELEGCREETLDLPGPVVGQFRP